MHIVKNAATEKHLEMLRVLADFVDCDIEYYDSGKGEDITLIRSDGQRLVLNARGNQYDGGFLVLQREIP